MDEIVSILISFGLATIGGFAVGYTLRKIMKIALVIVGLFLFAFIAMQGAGWIDPDYNKMTADATQIVNSTSANLGPQLTYFTNQFNIVILAGLSIGVIAGFVKGG